jgi:hypothetical protein
MKPRPAWRSLGFDNGFWDLVRYYRSLKTKGPEWLNLQLTEGSRIGTKSELDQLRDYVANAATDRDSVFACLRTEEEALAFCNDLGTSTTTTATQSEDHHQSSNALVAAVSRIAANVCGAETTFVPSPQARAVWHLDNLLHVTARNMDGAIPSLLNPYMIWEIKEYWGKTGGGSKMSDAVYECHLVGLELRTFERKLKRKIEHVVFIDGKVQWGSRKSDVVRFIDLCHQGLIDHLICGREVETEWEPILRQVVSRK